ALLTKARHNHARYSKPIEQPVSHEARIYDPVDQDSGSIASDHDHSTLDDGTDDEGQPLLVQPRTHNEDSTGRLDSNALASPRKDESHYVKWWWTWLDWLTPCCSPDD
ncbi:hypothetical protein H4R35_003510, partial [Dimargaris xerosporica]